MRNVITICSDYELSTKSYSRQVTNILLYVPRFASDAKPLAIESFVKPALLYKLTTIVLRAADDRILSPVLKTGRGMAHICLSRREKAVHELHAAIPTTSIATQLRSRRLKLCTSACNNSGLTKIVYQSDLQRAGGGSPVQQRNWLHQIRTDEAEILKVHHWHSQRSI